MNEIGIVWVPEADEILLVKDASDIEGPGIVTGTLYDDDFVVLDMNRVDYPINVEYFLDVWNSLYPNVMLAPSQVYFERDGEHLPLIHTSHRKEAMPPAGIPAGKGLGRLGALGENLVHLIPGLSNIESVKIGDEVHDVDVAFDYNGVRYGAEVKTNGRNGYDPYRYRITGYGKYSLAYVRDAKSKYAENLGLVPATLGITVDFENSTFDACLLPGEIRTFLGGPRTLLAKDIPFDDDMGARPNKFDRPNFEEARIPGPFLRPGETTNPGWKKKKVTPPAPDPDQVFGSVKEAAKIDELVRRAEKGDKFLKAALIKSANILDPIHEELDQRVFRGIEPRLELFEGHLTHIRETFRQNGFDHTAFEFYLTGSISTYQYSDTSDVDITVVCIVEDFKDEDRAELVSIVTRSLDGKKFPGTNYPFQHFVQPPGVDVFDLFKTGLRSAYDLQKGEWIVEPSRERAINIQTEYPDWFAEAIQVSEKMNTLIDGGNYEDAFAYYKTIHARRKADQLKYGDISSGNVIYKFLINNQTIDRLRNVGYQIAT